MNEKKMEMEIEGVLGDKGSDADGQTEKFSVVSALSWGIVAWTDRQLCA